LALSDEPRGARPSGGHCTAVGCHFMLAKYIRVFSVLWRRKSARPVGRTGAARRRVPRLDSALWALGQTAATGQR